MATAPALLLQRNPLVCGAAGVLLAASGGYLSLALAALALAAGWWLRRHQRHIPLSLPCFLLAAGIMGGYWRTSASESQDRALLLPVEGTSLDAPLLVDSAFHPPPGTDKSPWFTGRLAAGPASGLTLRVMLPPDAGPTLPGSLVQITGRFRLPTVPTNPWEWDEREKFAADGLAGKLWQSRDRPLVLLRPPPWWHPLAWGTRCRMALAGMLATGLPDPDQRAVVLGISLGMSQGIGDDALLAFRRTGSLHLFSVSGMHVGMLVSLLWFAMHPLAVPRRRLALLLIPLVFSYALMTGWQSPAVRAAVMTSVFLAGLALDRAPRLLNSLSAAFIVLMLWDPRQRHDLGFQLTFSIVAAIAIIGLPLAAKFAVIGRPDPFLPADLVSVGQRRWARLVQLAAGSLAFGIAANIGSLPYSLYHFNLVTPSGIILGLALVPLSWLILGGTLLSAIPGAIGMPALTAAMGNILGPLAAGCLHLCTWGAALPAAWLVPKHPPAHAAEALVFDLDRGGASMLVRSGEKSWLLDTGNPGHAKRITGQACTQLGAVPLDLLIVTHADVQHRGGLADLEKITDPPRFRMLEPNSTGLQLTRNMDLQILFPPQGWKSSRADDRAAVIRWDLLDWRLLWLGDAGFTAQKWMLDNLPPESLACDVLCVGWHANDIGLLREFVLAAQPKLVIWHRWRPETLQPPDDSLRRFLRQHGIALMEQSRTGAVTLTINPDKLEARPFLPGVATVTLSHPRAADADAGSSSPAPSNAPRNPSAGNKSPPPPSPPAPTPDNP